MGVNNQCSKNWSSSAHNKLIQLYDKLFFLLNVGKLKGNLVYEFQILGVHNIAKYFYMIFPICY